MARLGPAGRGLARSGKARLGKARLGKARFYLGGPMSKDKEDCDETMESMQIAGHMHVCSGYHDDGCHFCKECKRWFWKKEDL